MDCYDQLLKQLHLKAGRMAFIVKQILFGFPVWISFSYDAPALEIHSHSLRRHHQSMQSSAHLQRCVGCILDNFAFLVLFFFLVVCFSLSFILTNLFLLQARDDILNGSHPVSFDKACEFAGIQAQIQFGPHVEHKHKPGFLE